MPEKENASPCLGRGVFFRIVESLLRIGELLTPFNITPIYVKISLMGKVVSINISEKKGARKKQRDEVVIKTNYGIEGDAHASETWHRQISLLAYESIEKMQDKGLDVGSGDFAENITTVGIDLFSLPVGARMSLGEEVEVEVSQIGKECKKKCKIYYQAGDCVMPKEGIFVTVSKGGVLRKGDKVSIKS